MLRSGLTGAVAAIFLFGGGLGAYDRWAAGWGLPWPASGVLFFLGLHWAQTLLAAPFAYYRALRLEERHGFNRMGKGLWLADLVRGELIGSLLLAALSGGALWLEHTSPERWWLWVWALSCGTSVLLLYLSPLVLDPLFHRFTPVEDDRLKESIRALAARAGVGVEQVLRVDASRRTAHSNAYFSGIGRVKRVVLFDTLLEQMPATEVLAVLAHELGHWRLRHLPRRLVGSAAVGLAGFWCAGQLLMWEGLPSLVGLGQGSIPCRAVVLGLLASLAAFPLTPAANALSRRHEGEADRYACTLTGDSRHLASALVTLARENLANLNPHPLYAWFYASHPPIAGRVAALRNRTSTGAVA
jgi:STE24 endopeptidase